MSVINLDPWRFPRDVNTVSSVVSARDYRRLLSPSRYLAISDIFVTSSKIELSLPAATESLI